MSHNLIPESASSFDVDTSDWTVTNGVASRILSLGPYSLDFVGSNSDTPINLMGINADGGGVVTAVSPTFAVVPGDALISKAVVSTNLYSGLRNGFASIEVVWFSDEVTSLSPYPSTVAFTDADITNDTDPLLGTGPDWYTVSSLTPVPDGAFFGKLKLSFSSTEVGAGALIGDRFAVAGPSVVSMSDISEGFVNIVYAALPEFMRSDDLSAPILSPLFRLVAALSSDASSVSALAESFEYIKAIEADDGVGQSSALTDPDLMSAGGMPWLAALMGVSLSSVGANFAPWSALASYDSADAGSITGQWDDFEAIGDWAAIEGFGVGFTDPTKTFRDQLRTGFSGIHAGKLDTIEAFIRTLLNSDTPDNEIVALKKRDRDTPFLLEVDIDSGTDPDPGGNTVQSVLQSGLPAGVASTVHSTATPVAHSSLTMLVLDDDFASATGVVAGAGEYGAQGLSNVEGGTSTASLMNSSLNTDPLLGGIIGEAPFTVGKALFSGLQVQAKSATSATLDPVGDFDLIIGVSNITTPTGPSGTGTESGAVNGRVLAYGNNWSLHVSKADELVFLHNGTLALDVLTATVPYSFTEESANGILWIRVEKTGETLNFYVQRSLYDDWSTNQVGTSLALTSGNGAMSSAGAAAYVAVLNSTAPSPPTNINDLALPCVVHRVLLFTGSLASGAWAAEPDGNYNYSTDNTALKLDIDFNKNPTTNYETSFTATVGGTVTVTDAGGANTNQMHGMVASAVSGDTFYFGKSPRQFDVTNPLNAGDTIVALVANGTYDWKMTYVDVSNDAVPLTQTVTAVAASGGTGITWDADDYGDRAIIKIEVVLNSSGVFDAGNDEAMFLPNTIPPDGTVQEGTTSGVDTATNGPVTWNLNRSYHVGVGEEYLPSQLLDRNFLHMQNGVVTVENVKPLDIHSVASYAFLIRTFHSGGVDDIMRHLDDNSNGMVVQFSGTNITASMTDGTNTLGPIAWDASGDGRVGYWNMVVVRYSPNIGLSINVNGHERAVATSPEMSNILVGPNNQIVLSEVGDLKDFGLAGFSVYDRYLTDEECVLLNGEMNITPSGFGSSEAFGYTTATSGTVVTVGTLNSSFGSLGSLTGAVINAVAGTATGSAGPAVSAASGEVTVNGSATTVIASGSATSGLVRRSSDAAGSYGFAPSISGVVTMPGVAAATFAGTSTAGGVRVGSEGAAAQVFAVTGHGTEAGLIIGNGVQNFNVIEAFGSATGTVL